ncbi:MAG: ethanolamine utilization protein EutN [Verrucomicrobiales bacterium]|jgi:ethanolamine utilization protein EutN|nr:ethanolamine utilization protein EutN [Verrucomicrobiales bacterium]MDP6679231.1 EutN/CcmL family microcompartment protein [Verrucomicrobiota bacterium]MDP6753948.1 EutN/CcmL family microcompartment protein [Verrucomicrobiota bacterium]MDP7012780.1 EutN/CcmL family microcompartment protein [Verrucomicrobiota bacterium]
MRLGKVIGRVTLSQTIPSFEGGRWLVVNPYTSDDFQSGATPPEGLSAEPSLVVFDALGGDVGQTIGFIEGREAAAPFTEPTPVDAINAALVDTVYHKPMK